MRLISCRSAAVETLGIVEGDRWLPASIVLAGAPSTVGALLENVCRVEATVVTAA